MSCNGVVGNQYSKRNIYEEQLREIVANLNYVRTVGGFRVSNHEGEPINEWVACANTATQANTGLVVTPDNIIFTFQNTQSGNFTTQTAHVLRSFDILGNAIASVTFAHGGAANQIAGMTDFCIDGSGLVHIYDAVAAVIKVFNQSGVHQFNYSGTLSSGGCIGYNPVNDRIYLADNLGTLYAYTPTGALLFVRNTTVTDGIGVVAFRSVCFPQSNNVVAYDQTNQAVRIYDADLATYIATWTIATAANGHGIGAANTRVSIDWVNQLYFGTSTNEIVRCNLNGVYQASWGGTGSGLGLFNFVGYVRNLSTGQLLIADGADDTITRYRASIVFIDVDWHALRKYSGTTGCSVNPVGRIVPWGYNADGILVPSPGVMNVPIPRTILGSGHYQAPLHILAIRDLRLYIDEMAVSEQLVNFRTLETLKRDWSTENDLYYAAIGSDADRLEAVDGTKIYSWQRSLGRIAALRPHPRDFIELKFTSEFLRNCAIAMVGAA